MRLLAISLARLTVLTPPAEFNPKNSVSIPEFTRAMVERYGLLKFPKTVEDYDLSKGVVFGLGKVNNINIESIILYHCGLVIDTRSSTKDCEAVLGDLTAWVQELFGIEYSPISEPRKFFLSELSFYSDLKLLSPDIAERIMKKIHTLRDGLAGDVKRMTNFRPAYRLRVGDYRVLFDIDGRRIIIYRVRHRREAYRP